MSDVGPGLGSAEIRVAVVPDNADMDAIGDRLARELREAGVKGSADVNRALGRALDTFRRDSGKSLGSLTTELAKAARAATTGLKGAADEAGRMRQDVKAMSLLLEAQQNNKLIDPNQFALLRRIQASLLETQRTIAKTNFSDPQAVKALRSNLDTQRRLVNSANITLQSTVKQSTAQIIEQERRRTLGARAEATKRTEQERSAAVAQNAIIRRQQDEMLVATQTASRQRVQITRFALETLGRLEKGFGAIVAGTARTATGAVSRIYSDTLGRVSGLIRRHNSQVNALTAAGGRERNSIFRSSLRSQERLVQQSMTRQTEIIRTAQARAQTGIVGAARRSSLLGLGGGLAGAGFLTAGFTRFSDIEALQRQFEALTGSATDAAQILQEVRDFAKKTPFDVTGVATLAKGFLAMKTPLDQVLPRVRLLADAVALTGGNAQSLERIQRALGQVISAGRLQGDELNQLAENLPGLNIRQILADQLTGGDLRTLNDLQEAGEISADAFINGILGGLAADTRLVGASEDLAKTLGGRFANLKESFQDTAASVIGLFADQLKLSMQGAEIALSNISSFIKGDVGPAFLLLRTAVGGASVAIGALLVAKVAGEALKILATSARLLLTPFGLVILTVGAIGAAFAVLRDRSEEFRAVTDRLTKFLGTTFGNVWSSIVETFDRVVGAFTRVQSSAAIVSDAIRNSLPPTESFITLIGRRLGDAIATAGRFLSDTLIPALGDLAIFIGKNIGPAIRFAVDQFGLLFDAVQQFAAPIVTSAFEKVQTALGKVRDIGGEVFETLKTAAQSSAEGMRIALSPIGRIIEGLQNIRKDLGPELLGIGGAALAGGLIAGPVGALVAGVGTAVATLSPTIRDTITDGFRQAIANVTRLLRGINWGALAGGALKFVERAGRILGTIVSDRRFVTALLGIAAAAGAVAFKFVQGFASGVLSNLGELTDLGRDIAAAIISGIIGFVSSNPIDAALLIGAAVLIKGMFSIGKQMGTQLTSGFSKARLTIAGGGDFLTGFFGGARGIEAQARSVVAKTQAALDTEFRRSSSALSRAAGAGGVLRVSGASSVDIQGIRKEMGQLEAEVGRGAAAGLRLRTAFADTFASIRTNSGGLKGIFSSLKTGAGDVAASLKGQGAAIGSALGVGVVSAFTAAVGGQQLAKGNVAGGLGTILMSSLTAGFLIGGPAGIAIGGAVASFGLLTAAFTKGKEAAKKAAEAVKAYRDIILDASRAGEDAAPKIIEQILDTILDQSPKVRAALTEVGITAEDVFDFAGLDTKIRDQIGEATRSINDLGEVTRGSKAEQLELQEALAAVGRVANTEARLALEGLIQAYVDGTISGGTLATTVDLIKNQIFSQAEAAQQAAIDMKLLGDASEAGATSAANLFEARLAGSGLSNKLSAASTATDTLVTDLQAAKTAVDKLLNPTEGTLASEVAAAVSALSGIGSTIATGFDIGGLVGGAQAAGGLEDLRRQISSVTQKGLEEGASEAQIDDNLRLITLAISELELPEDVKAAMRAELQTAIDADVIAVDVNAVANVESAQQAARDLTTAASEAVSTSALERPGSEVGGGFARGIRSALDRVKAAVKLLTDQATLAANVNLDIKSPSKVFEQIGAFTAEGFSLGIINSLGFVEAAGTQMGDTFREATVEAVSKLNDEIAALRPNLFESLLAGGSDRDSALRGIQGGLRGFSDELATNIREAIEAGTAPNLSIDFGAGLENRNALAEVVNDLKQFGAELLKSGATPGEVITAVLQKRAEALDIAAFLGFDRTTVEAFFDGLGLSVAGLQEFGTKLAEETEALKKKAEQDEAEQRKKDEPAPEPSIEQTVTVQLSVPFGDPEAIALAVANKTAVLARRGR